MYYGYGYQGNKYHKYKITYLISSNLLKIIILQVWEGMMQVETNKLSKRMSLTH